MICGGYAGQPQHRVFYQELLRFLFMPEGL